MKSILLFILLAISIAVPASSQVLPQLKREKPDLEKIKQAINDRTSPGGGGRGMGGCGGAGTGMKIGR